MYPTPQKKICISFDWSDDMRYRFLLNALAANPDNDLTFKDLTPGEIKSYEITKIKAGLLGGIMGATHTLVLVGDNANMPHPDRAQIGTRNWIWWEIEQSKAYKKKLIAVKINASNPTPEPLLNSGAKWAMSYNVPAIIKAIREA